MGLTMLNGQNECTAAIAAFVASAIVISTLAIILFRIRRRRSRIRERRTPDQFFGSQEHIVQIPPAKAALVVLESTEPKVNRLNLLGAPVLADAERKRATQKTPRHDSADSQLPGRPIVVPEESAAATSDPEEVARGDEETMTLRVRRLEAQFEALLAGGLPDSSPPSYYG
ncbi:hypothetical protein C8R45DRAFT_419337 [Mycena sanguinolenta]|nr:hypothetical protein C8R45DRAFT_419337 [Mycena sanguinolenta]